MPDADDLQALLREGATQLGLPLTLEQVAHCLDYLALLQRWARVYNLTAVLKPAEMVSHHLLDCLAVISPLRHHLASAADARGVRVLDVGAGAGLPGVLIALMCPAVQVLCVDAVAKKVAFIRQAALALGLPNLRATHGRVEALTEPPFDVVTSRAFASLADFVRLTRFHVKPGGIWMAMKGKTPDVELTQLPQDVVVTRVEPLVVPQLNAERCLVWMSRRGPLDAPASQTDGPVA